jgi:3-deoxy-D-manno-octulosonate 8-phosphate phosphatase (KDO 8-P phosphatase)
VSVVSGRSSPAVARRMADLGVTDVHQGVSDKLALLGALCERHGIDAGATAFMGDDLPDLPLLGAVGLALAPADAVPDVRRVAHWISRRRGGAGAVREAIDWLLSARRPRRTGGDRAASPGAASPSAGTPRSVVPRFAS